MTPKAGTDRTADGAPRAKRDKENMVLGTSARSGVESLPDVGGDAVRSPSKFGCILRCNAQREQARISVGLAMVKPIARASIPELYLAWTHDHGIAFVIDEVVAEPMIGHAIAAPWRAPLIDRPSVVALDELRAKAGQEHGMRIRLIASVAALAIAAAGCNNANQETAEANSSNDMMVNDGMATPADMATNNMTAAPMAATEFAAAVAGSDMYEIDSGKLAATKATSQQLEDFGGMLVAEHSKSSTDFKTAAAASTPPVTLPTALPSEHRAHLDALKAATGAAFDRLFLEQQKASHQKTLATLQAYATSGGSQSLKDFAGKAAPIVEQHLTQLHSMKG